MVGVAGDEFHPSRVAFAELKKVADSVVSTKVLLLVTCVVVVVVVALLLFLFMLLLLLPLLSDVEFDCLLMLWVSTH